MGEFKKRAIKEATQSKFNYAQVCKLKNGGQTNRTSSTWTAPCYLFLSLPLTRNYTRTPAPCTMSVRFKYGNYKLSTMMLLCCSSWGCRRPSEEVQISRPTKHTSRSSMHRIGILYLPLILRRILAFISLPLHFGGWGTHGTVDGGENKKDTPPSLVRSSILTSFRSVSSTKVVGKRQTVTQYRNTKRPESGPAGWLDGKNRMTVWTGNGDLEQGRRGGTEEVHWSSELL